MGQVQVGETTVHYTIDGHGPWLTLLHGFSQNLDIWLPQVERLSGMFRVLRIDLRGHGGSVTQNEGYGPVEYASDVIAVLDALSIGATHFWGTHTGAGVGLLLAVEQPDRLAALVLDGAVIPGQPEPAVDAWQAQARDIALTNGIEAARTFWFDQSPFFSGTQRPEQHRAIIETFSGAPWFSTVRPQPVPDVAGALASIRHQTLIVNGANDLPTFLTRAEDLERELPNARRYVIPNAGAFAAWDAPGAVTPLVAQFIEDGE